MGTARSWRSCLRTTCRRGSVGHTRGVTLPRTPATFPHMGSVPKAAALMSLVAVPPRPVDTSPGADPLLFPAVPDPAPSIDHLWRAALPTSGELRRARRRLHVKALLIVVLVGASYWALVLSGIPLLARLGCRRRPRHRPGRRRHVRSCTTPTTARSRPARWVNRVLAYTSDLLGAQLVAVAVPAQHPAPRQHQRRRVRRRPRPRPVRPAGAVTALAPVVPGAAHLHLAAVRVPGPQEPARQRLSWRSITGRLDQQPLRQRVRPRVVAQITAGKLAHLVVGRRDPAAVQPVVGRARLLPRVLVARRLRAARSRSSSPTASTSPTPR